MHSVIDNILLIAPYVVQRYFCQVVWLGINEIILVLVQVGSEMNNLDFFITPQR